MLQLRLCSSAKNNNGNKSYNSISSYLLSAYSVLVAMYMLYPARQTLLPHFTGGNTEALRW